MITEKELRAEDLKEFIPVLRAGFELRRLSDFHLRIAERLDIYMALRRLTWTWHDIKTQERGHIHLYELSQFVLKHLAEPVVKEQEGPLNAFEEGLEDLICASAPSKDIIAYVRKKIQELEGAAQK